MDSFAQLMGHSQAFQRIVSLSNVPTRLSPYNPRRVSLLVYGNNPGLNVMSMDQNITYPQGIQIWNDNRATPLSILNVGKGVQQAWYGISSIAGPSTIYVIEVELDVDL